MKTIQIDRSVLKYLTSKALKPGEAPSLILRRELHLSQPTESVEIDDDTYEYLLSKTVNLGESASDILRRELKIESEPVVDPATAVVFHIAAGTGALSWNTREHMIETVVGKTLHIFNDDSIPHRLHTTGTPFAHPSADIPPGQSAAFVLQAPFDPIVGQPLHDHAAGPSAQFWILVRPAP